MCYFRVSNILSKFILNIFKMLLNEKTFKVKCDKQFTYLLTRFRHSLIVSVVWIFVFFVFSFKIQGYKCLQPTAMAPTESVRGWGRLKIAPCEHSCGRLNILTWVAVHIISHFYLIQLDLMRIMWSYKDNPNDLYIYIMWLIILCGQQQQLKFQPPPIREPS